MQHGGQLLITFSLIANSLCFSWKTILVLQSQASFTSKNIELPARRASPKPQHSITLLLRLCFVTHEKTGDQTFVYFKPWIDKLRKDKQFKEDILNSSTLNQFLGINSLSASVALISKPVN